LRDGNKIVEETFPSSIRPGSGQCTHLHNKSSKKNMSLEIFCEKVAEVLLANAGTEIQVQGQTGGFVGKDHSVYSTPATHATLEGKSQLSFL
jgi:hypothetical protein